MRVTSRSIVLAPAGAALLLLAGELPAGAAGDTATERVSVSSNGTEGNADSEVAAISATGRFVAIESYATNLVGGDGRFTADIFLHDRVAGQTTLVSASTSGGYPDNESHGPAISADGRHVAFWSYAGDLVAGDTNRGADVFVRDVAAGAGAGRTFRVSVASDGSQVAGVSWQPSISADGRYVAFHSRADNLVVGDDNDRDDVFVHDRVSGQTTRVSVDSNGGQADNSSYAASISADGRRVAYVSSARNLVVGDTNFRNDVFVHDRGTGQTRRVSVATGGSQANSDSDFPAISGNGRHVTYFSAASNLVPGDTNGNADVFVHDLEVRRTSRVSVASDGRQANRAVTSPDLSYDGRYVCFLSDASNLVAGDTNFGTDVFVHDRLTGQTTRESVASDGTQADNLSLFPVISGDGRHVAFTSAARNLVPGDRNQAEDIFVHSRTG